MQFQITEIEFDFGEDDHLHPGEKADIVNDTVGQIWEADDEDDLIEEVTCATGWCVKSLNYRHVLA